MNKIVRKVSAMSMGALTTLLTTMPVFAAEETAGAIGEKAYASSIAIGLVAAAGAIAMGMAISKAAEGVSKQPEASSKIQTILMLGLVFIETAIIYALIIAILIIFVL
ncbi:MAG: ATP synthase F0 subunit C [Bacillota bacterium]|nr:ATP synthase F0 subunit C [Bacillota bacterium]